MFSLPKVKRVVSGHLSRIERFRVCSRVMSAAVPGQTQVEQTGVGPVIEDQVGTASVARRVYRLAQAQHHILRPRHLIAVSPEIWIEMLDQRRLHLHRPGQAARVECCGQIF